MSFSGKFNTRKLRFPFRIAKFTDGYFITGIAGEHKKYFGYEVKSINGNPLKNIFIKLSKISIADNEFGRLFNIPAILSYALILKSMNIINNENYMNLELIDANGKIIKVKINSTLSINHNNYQNLKKSLDQKIPIRLINEDKYYWFEHFMEKRAVYFQFNKVANQGNESFKQFNTRLWKYIDTNKNDIDKLIIDLRNNRGGSGRLLMPFINNIIKRDYINKDGKIYVLTSNATYSAAVVLITDLLQHCMVTYIGEPPACPSNFFSNSSFVGRLPNSGFRLNISTRQIENAWSNERNYFAPDIPAPFSSKDFFTGSDPALERIFDGNNKKIEEIALEEGIEEAFHNYNEMKKKYANVKWWINSTKIETRLNSQAYHYLNSNKIEEAYKIFKLNTLVFPNSYNVWDSLGEIHIIQDDFEIAFTSYKKALSLLAPNDKSRRTTENNVNGLGYRFLIINDINKAINIFKLNTKLFPNSANVYDSLGEAYLENGNKEQAIFHL